MNIDNLEKLCKVLVEADLSRIRNALDTSNKIAPYSLGLAAYLLENNLINIDKLKSLNIEEDLESELEALQVVNLLQGKHE